MRTVAIVQARMGSTRLPGKVLKDVAGETMLGRVVRRLRGAKQIDEVLIATTDSPTDDAIVAECQRYSIAVFRGDQDDVLDRYFEAAKFTDAEIVVRVTSDCPLIDPEITERTIRAFMDHSPDYASNTIVRTFPRGLDTEVVSMAALTRAWQEARRPYEREHVTPYILEHPEEFVLLPVVGDQDYSAHRWTVDMPKDLEFVRAIYNRLKGEGEFSCRDVLDVLDREPELLGLNRGVVQKSVR
ncbi:MAG: glycosyltransferase family protein [Candidatus Sulfotelmatobacter sp.]